MNKIQVVKSMYLKVERWLVLPTLGVIVRCAVRFSWLETYMAVSISWVSLFVAVFILCGLTYLNMPCFWLFGAPKLVCSKLCRNMQHHHAWVRHLPGPSPCSSFLGPVLDILAKNQNKPKKELCWNVQVEPSILLVGSETSDRSPSQGAGARAMLCAAGFLFEVGGPFAVISLESFSIFIIIYP